MEAVELFGLDEFWKDIGINFLTGLGFILLNLLAPSIAIGIPFFPQATLTTNLLVVGVIAPIVENIAIIGLVLVIAYKLLKRFMSDYAAAYSAAFIAAIVFSLFHWAAYGASLSAQNASFIGAILFGFITAMMIIWTKNVVATIITHSMFNLFIMSSYFLVIAGAF